jgi:hypothetical protein
MEKEMTKPPETEGLRTLRHRWGRTIEVGAAYYAFRKKEVLVGEKFTCPTEHFRWQTTHTLLACFYSFIYSLFDSRGVNFKDVSKEVICQLPDPGNEVAERILDYWREIEENVQMIRHTIGFHGARKRKGVERGYEAYKRLHPLSSEYIMTLMMVFFRLVETRYEVLEVRVLPSDPDRTNQLMQIARDLKSQMEKSPDADIFKELMMSLTSNQM